MKTAQSVTDVNLPIELAELQRLFKKHGVLEASIFGSYARGEARSDSDLDILVKLAPDRNLFDLGGLQYDLDELLPGSIDVMTKLNKHFEPYITPDLVRIL